MGGGAVRTVALVVVEVARTPALRFRCLWERFLGAGGLAELTEAGVVAVWAGGVVLCGAAAPPQAARAAVRAITVASRRKRTVIEDNRSEGLLRRLGETATEA